MKNTFKRIAAFAVMICMLLSVVPAVAFAEETVPQQLDTITYDFDQRAQEFTYTSGDNTSTLALAGQNLQEVSIKGVAARAKIAELYDAGTIDWNYHSAGNISSAATAFSFSFGADDVNYILTLRNGSHTAGSYFAATIRSPGTGDYKLTLDYFTHQTGAAQGSVYVLPGSVTDIVAAMEYYEPVGSFSCESTVSSATALGTATATFSNTVSMKAGEEYVLVFTNDAVSVQRNDRATLYLGNVTLNKQQPAQNLDTVSYDFAAARTEFAGTTVNIKLTGTSATDAVINTRYAEGTQDWKFHSTGNTTGGTATAVNFNLNKSTVYGAQLVTAGYLNKAYYAITVRSPGSGDYALSVNYWTHSTGASKGSIYILPGDTTDVAAAIDAATAVGSFNSDSGVASFTSVSTQTMANAVSMEAGAEYLLVFTADEYAAVGNRATLYIDSVSLDRIVSQDELQYNFDLGNIKDGEGNALVGNGTDFYGRNVVGTNASSVNRQNAIKDYYTDEVINWYYHSTSGSSFTTANSTAVNRGVYMQGASHATGCYFATVIRSPGPGSYTLTLNIWDHNTSATEASVYLLPVGTENIAAALTAENELGNIYCDSTSATFALESTSFDVQLDMSAEYLLVFTNDAMASNGTRSYIYLDSVVMNKAAGGSGEVELPDTYIAGGEYFDDFSAAVRAAFESDQIVALNKDVTVDELKLTEDIAIDLNGKTLTANAFGGKMIDSSDGNTGLLASQKDNVVFSSKNTDAPLYDAATGGYRLFDYTLELYDGAEEVEGAAYTQKFWFKYHFRTGDAAEAPLDEDAYAIVAAGDSGVTFGVELYWNDEALEPAVFGLNGSTDAFAQGWADGATASRWLWVNVQGLNPASMNGTLVVVPVVEVNNVRITNDKIVYTCGEIAE